MVVAEVTVLEDDPAFDAGICVLDDSGSLCLAPFWGVGGGWGGGLGRGGGVE